MAIQVYEDTNKHGDLFLTIVQVGWKTFQQVEIETIEDAKLVAEKLISYIRELEDKGYD